MTKIQMPDRSKPFDGRGGIHYIRWRYGVPAKIGGRVRMKLPGSIWHGKLGTITGVSSHLIVRPDERPYKGTRCIVHPLELEYLTATAEQSESEAQA